MIRIDIAIDQGDFHLNASIETPDRGVTGIFGPSGSGKTTIINAVAGLVIPTSGRISVGKRVLFDRTAGISLPPEKRRIGYVFQEDRLFPHMDVRQNLLYGARRRASIATAKIDPIIEMLGIGPLLRRRIANLSGGEAQRVAIGRALLSAPDILLMDEPLSSLDQSRKEEVLPYLERLADHSGVPILYVTHAIEEMIRLADHAAVIEEGKISACGPLAEVMARSNVPSLIKRRDAGTIIHATVTGHDLDDSVTKITFDGRTLYVPLLDRPEGALVAVRILARDVAISLECPEHTSVLNILPATISEILEGPEARVDVTLDAGQTIRARITRRSARRLGLEPGMSIFALVKAVSFADRNTRRREPVPGAPPSEGP